jgi:hypothetical protein
MRWKERKTEKERKENIEGIWKERKTVGRDINREGGKSKEGKTKRERENSDIWKRERERERENSDIWKRERERENSDVWKRERERIVIYERECSREGGRNEERVREGNGQSEWVQ